MTELTTEQIWVTAKEAAEVTSYHPRSLDRLMRNILLQPQEERAVRIHQDDNGYKLWLPDLINFVAQYGAGRLLTKAEEIWVNTPEAAEITGYTRDYVQKLARVNWKLPEDQRLIKVRFRANRYDVWLPDLVNFIISHGHGPHQKTSKRIS